MSLDRFRKTNHTMNYKGHCASLVDNNLYIDSELVYEGCDIKSAYAYSKSYIDSLIILENNTVSRQNIAKLIAKHHSDVKLTNTLIEAYADLISYAKEFTLDPVLLECKEQCSFYNKLEFTLKDGSNVAIDEETINKLSTLNVDKYKLVDFMNESKENFISIIKELRE